MTQLWNGRQDWSIWTQAEIEVYLAAHYGDPEGENYTPPEEARQTAKLYVALRKINSDRIERVTIEEANRVLEQILEENLQ